MKIDPNNLKINLRNMLGVSEADIGCNACMEMVDEFVELQLAGRDAAEVLPLVHTHLSQCKDCQEEFEALKNILQNYPVS